MTGHTVNLGDGVISAENGNDFFKGGRLCFYFKIAGNCPIDFLGIDDEEHSVFEERFRGIGSIRGIVIITTCFVERGERIRIINARRATAYEEGIYNENFKKYF